MQPELLIGQKLDGGWTIESPRQVPTNMTGGAHSFGYTAKHNNGKEAFIKILDIAPKDHAADSLSEVQSRINLFQYERKLVEKCSDRYSGSMDHVVRGLGFGTFTIENWPLPIYYLIFELAECNLREQVDIASQFEVSLRFLVLHQVAVGLNQLHQVQIAHQDIKPSNVLIFSHRKTKIGDLGHAHDRESPRPGEVDSPIAADPTYAPPEQLYSFVPNNWDVRRLSADLYHLGNLAVFLFSGGVGTSALAPHLRAEHHWRKWSGSYSDVLPYIREATDKLLYDVANNLDESYKKDFIELLRYLIEPDPALRCHPRNSAGGGRKYGLERFISGFDILARKARLKPQPRPPK